MKKFVTLSALLIAAIAFNAGRPEPSGFARLQRAGGGAAPRYVFPQRRSGCVYHASPAFQAFPDFLH